MNGAGLRMWIEGGLCGQKEGLREQWEGPCGQWEGLSEQREGPCGQRVQPWMLEVAEVVMYDVFLGKWSSTGFVTVLFNCELIMCSLIARWITTSSFEGFCLYLSMYRHSFDLCAVVCMHICLFLCPSLLPFHPSPSPTLPLCLASLPPLSLPSRPRVTSPH